MKVTVAHMQCKLLVIQIKEDAPEFGKINKASWIPQTMIEWLLLRHRQSLDCKITAQHLISMGRGTCIDKIILRT